MDETTLLAIIKMINVRIGNLKYTGPTNIPHWDQESWEELTVYQTSVNTLTDLRDHLQSFIEPEEEEPCLCSGCVQQREQWEDEQREREETEH